MSFLDLSSRRKSILCVKFVFKNYWKHSAFLGFDAVENFFLRIILKKQT